MGRKWSLTMPPPKRYRVIQLKEAAHFSGGIRMGDRRCISLSCRVIDLAQGNLRLR
jgi:hypothetical protein